MREKNFQFPIKSISRAYSTFMHLSETLRWLEMFLKSFFLMSILWDNKIAKFQFNFFTSFFNSILIANHRCWIQESSLFFIFHIMFTCILNENWKCIYRNRKIAKIIILKVVTMVKFWYSLRPIMFIEQKWEKNTVMRQKRVVYLSIISSDVRFLSTVFLFQNKMRKKVLHCMFWC